MRSSTVLLVSPTQSQPLLPTGFGVSTSGGTGTEHDGIPPVHLVLPDTVTGEVLVSIADSLAGVEISRLRWCKTSSGAASH